MKIDGVLRDWNERIGTGKLKGKKGRNVSGGKYEKQTPIHGPATKASIAATVKKTPEVMVKISGGPKGMEAIKAHLDYISRNGEVEIEDEQGRVHSGKEEVSEVRDDWKGGGIPTKDGKYKQAFNIILSMPPGTDRQAVKDAARDFAAERFANHKYVFAAHDDEKHPHVHLTVRALDHDGIRLNPRKADLQHWRETFAEKLRAHGIEANATPRKARGVVRKAEHQAIKHIDRGYAAGTRKAPARATEAQKADALKEVSEGKERVNPAQDNIIAARRKVQQGYGNVARVLATGDIEDKQLALEIVQFVKQIPPVVTKHQQLVASLRERPAQGLEKEKPKGIEPDVSKDR